MNGSQSRERELTAKKIGKILAEGFLEFIPYVTPVDSLGYSAYRKKENADDN